MEAEGARPEPADDALERRRRAARAGAREELRRVFSMREVIVGSLPPNMALPTAPFATAMSPKSTSVTSGVPVPVHPASGQVLTVPPAET